MKKSVLTIFMITIIVGINSSNCFANGGDGVQAYAEEQACITEMSKPVIYDRDYPELGLEAHSWVTGIGSNTIAHTQLIDRVTGTVIKEVTTHCNYEDPIYDYSGNN